MYLSIYEDSFDMLYRKIHNFFHICCVLFPWGNALKQYSEVPGQILHCDDSKNVKQLHYGEISFNTDLN